MVDLVVAAAGVLRICQVSHGQMHSGIPEASAWIDIRDDICTTGDCLLAASTFPNANSGSLDGVFAAECACVSCML